MRQLECGADNSLDGWISVRTPNVSSMTSERLR